MKKISAELKQDWESLMNGMLTVASDFEKFSVTVSKEHHIIINEDWDIMCYFISKKYITGVVEYKGKEVLKVMHLGKKHVTATTILEFIEKNLDT